MTNSKVQGPKVDYKSAGVDVEAGDSLVDWISSSAPKFPHSERVVSGVGGFASLFNIQFSEMKKPLLITCTDGVGTKVKLAAQFKKFKGVGQDLVAMCVNDLICTGGDPLQFLDYYATGKLNLDEAKEFLQGVREACIESDCALTGGETAEMPGVYQKGDFDCAGFAVGIVDQEKMWGAHKVQVGDCVLGLASSGFHSNGYSLVRKVFEQDLEKYQDELLVPTRLYVKVVQKIKSVAMIHAAANITGGGIENIPRVLPKNSFVDLKPWQFPKIFQEVKSRTGLSDYKLSKTLNCGLGFVLIFPDSEKERVVNVCQEFAIDTYDLGHVQAQPGLSDNHAQEAFVSFGGVFE